MAGSAPCKDNQVQRSRWPHSTACAAVISAPVALTCTTAHKELCAEPKSALLKRTGHAAPGLNTLPAPSSPLLVEMTTMTALSTCGRRGGGRGEGGVEGGRPGGGAAHWVLGHRLPAAQHRNTARLLSGSPPWRA